MNNGTFFLFLRNGELSWDNAILGVTGLGRDLSLDKGVMCQITYHPASHAYYRSELNTRTRKDKSVKCATSEAVFRCHQRGQSHI